MIFSTTVEHFYDEESYKERNLYYKIFAGYMFNELVRGEEQRMDSFLQLLKIKALFEEDKTIGTGSIEILEGISKENIQTTFDFHACQIVSTEDRGEMSDILLVSNNYFISIECKYLSDLHFNKDIDEVHNRIEKVAAGKFINKKPLQVLLIKGEKWKNIKKAEKSDNSFYKQLHTSNKNIPIIVLLWEDLLPIINDEIVISYLKKQLERVY